MQDNLAKTEDVDLFIQLKKSVSKDIFWHILDIYSPSIL